MINDPYAVLGVSPGAGQDEIKKAYRRKIKEYHPDLHPNDPAATKKTNEINEAYDMLQNPEKYEAQRKQQERQQQSRNPYGASGQQRSGQSYQGPGGWASDFGGFNFDEFFNFAFGGTQTGASTRPEAKPEDSREFRIVVTSINSGQYQDAIRVLTQIPSTGRNARWHYLYALASHGLENDAQAVDQMRRAVQMDPNNRLYHQLLQQFRNAEQTRSSQQGQSNGFNMPVISFGKILIGLFAVQLFFFLLQMLFGMGAHMYYLPG